MSQQPDLPPVYDHNAPPVYGTHYQQQTQEKPNWAKKLGPLGTFLLLILAKLKTFGTLILSVLKFGKLGSILLTSSSMLISVAVYSFAFGWQFAAGFVLAIFIHEMGHVLAAKAEGVPVSAPMFIPFMGAMINKKGYAQSAYGEAVIAIGGPAAGALAGFGSYLLFLSTQNPFFLALAYVVFIMNLFNLTPMYPLDGGRILGAVSPYFWAIGMVAMVVLMVTGVVRNPFIFILLIPAIPYMWHCMRYGTNDVPGQKPATRSEKAVISFAYLALAGFLFWSSGYTHDILRSRFMEDSPRRYQRPAPIQHEAPPNQVV